MNQKTVFLICLCLFASKASFSEDIEIDPSSLQPDKFADCDCTETERDCPPNCFFYCSLSEFIQDANRAINDKCSSDSAVTPLVDRQIVDFKSLESVFEEAEEKAAELSAETPPQKEGCEHCSSYLQLSNLTQPAEFETETCESQYIKTYVFDHKTPAIPACKEEDRGGVIKELMEYKGEVLGSEKLNEDCPDSCSFYINSVTKVHPSDCSGELSLRINCNHKRGGSFVFGMDYIVNILAIRKTQCEEVQGGG